MAVCARIAIQTGITRGHDPSAFLSTLAGDGTPGHEDSTTKREKPKASVLLSSVLTARFALTAVRASPARSEFYVDRPDVAQLRARGDAYVRAEFPKLSYISCAAAAQFSAQFWAQFLRAIL